MEESAEIALAILKTLPADLARGAEMSQLREHVRTQMPEGESNQVIDNVALALQREIQERQGAHRAARFDGSDFAP